MVSMSDAKAETPVSVAANLSQYIKTAYVSDILDIKIPVSRVD